MTKVVPSHSEDPMVVSQRSARSPQSSSAVRVIDLVSEILLYALLVFLPAAFGTVDPWSEMIATCFGAALAICLAVRMVLAPPRMGATAPLTGAAAAAIALFIGLAALQLVPLPRSVIGLISPQTVEVKTNLLDDLPDAANALSRLTISFYPRATRYDLRTVLLAVTVFALVVTVFHDPVRIRRLLTAVALIGGAIALLALAQDVSGTHNLYWFHAIDGPARSGPFFNHSHFGQFMNLSIGAALGLMLVRLESNWQRYRGASWLAATIVVGLMTIALSLTRGGVVSMLAAGAVTIAVLLSIKRLRWLGGVVMLLGVMTLIGLLYYGFGRVSDRMGTIGQGIADTRVQILRDLSALVQRFGLVGTGLGTFEYVYPAYDNTYSPSVASHAENEYAQVAAEMGLVGLATVLAFVGVICCRYVSAVRGGGPIGVAAIGLGYGLLAVMVHSLTDFGQHLPSNACLSAVTCGLLFNLGAAARQSEVRRREARHGRDAHATATRVFNERGSTMPRAVAVIGLLLVIALAAWAIMHAESARAGDTRWTEVKRLRNRLERRDWMAAPDEAAAFFAAGERVIAADPDNAYYRYWLGVYRWKEASKHRVPQGSALDAIGLAGAERAVEGLNDARRLCPTYGDVYTLLGQIEWNFLDRPIGMTHIQTAYELARNDPMAAYYAGELDAERGKFDAAAPKFRRALDYDYTLIDKIAKRYIELGHPEAGAKAVEGNWSLMLHYCRVLQQNGGFSEIVEPLTARGIDQLDATTAGQDASAGLIAILAGHRASQQRFDEAQRHFERALAMDESNLEWRLLRADALAKLGRSKDALEEARAALRLHPQSPKAKQAVEKLTSAARK
ncbi:MAG: O-antigen ligase family protein [Tepidisphaeraceae bacterium]